MARVLRTIPASKSETSSRETTSQGLCDTVFRTLFDDLCSMSPKAKPMKPQLLDKIREMKEHYSPNTYLEFQLVDDIIRYWAIHIISDICASVACAVREKSYYNKRQKDAFNRYKAAEAELIKIRKLSL